MIIPTVVIEVAMVIKVYFGLYCIYCFLKEILLLTLLTIVEDLDLLFRHWWNCNCFIGRGRGLCHNSFFVALTSSLVSNILSDSVWEKLMQRSLAGVVSSSVVLLFSAIAI